MGWLLFEVVEITNSGAHLPQNRFGWRWLLFEEIWTPSLPRDSTLQYKTCVHLWNNLPCIITLICCCKLARHRMNIRKQTVLIPHSIKGFLTHSCNSLYINSAYLIIELVLKVYLLIMKPRESFIWAYYIERKEL